MKKRVLRKVIVLTASVLLVGIILTGILGIKFLREQVRQKELEDTYLAPKPVMTQEEMEALYDKHKEDSNTGEEMIMEGGANQKEASVSMEEEKIDMEKEDPAGYTEMESPVIYEGCPVDFQGMWEVNSDVYAWITIPGTSIDYPILQHVIDNTYYLNYNIDGSYGYPGCIYTENMNSKDFTDNNTVIYGHNMKNGTMFAGLHKFVDGSFFKENSEIYIYTPEKELSYTIFAAYIYDDRHLMYSFNFADQSVYANYLEDIQNIRSMNANFREGVEVTAEDKIITLVTCIADQDDKRLLVQAVLDEQ